VEVTPGRAEHREAIVAFLRDHHTLRVARCGELLDASAHPAMLAWSDGALVGVATYVVRDDACELLTLHASTRQGGAGTRLLAAVREAARDAGCRRLWVVTTNDNVDALRFYQRRGFRLAHLRPGAVDVSRDHLKPEISRTGAYGIPLRDELELELDLEAP
jgi:N-acetylglutamate synthase-like GNAT family acetyltransferase